MSTKLRYREGDFFAVPLRDGGFATGLVARSGPKGKVLSGYFFGPRRTEPATLAVAGCCVPHDAVLVARFGDLSLQKEEWPMIGQAAWNREMWPVPDFGRVDTVSENLGWRVTYADEDPNEVYREVECSPKEALFLPRDSLPGSGAVEIKLGKLIRE
jgi:hypothetical protein